MNVATGSESAEGEAIHVFHVVENLHTGAVENWLLRMLRMSAEVGFNVRWTFYCTLGRAGVLDSEARRWGAEVLYSPVPIGAKYRFIRAMRAAMNSRRIDVLHCHHDYVSALYLLAAVGLPIRKRIVHVHNADDGLLTPCRLKQMLMKEPLREICLHLASQIVGISNHTLQTFIGDNGAAAGKGTVLYYGLDTKPFHCPVDREAFRRQNRLEPAAQILLFVGRLVGYKNPLFLVDTLEFMLEENPSVAAVFVGTGDVEQQLAAAAARKNISHRVRCLGWRDDIPAIMGCADLFVFPRHEEKRDGIGLEGLGLVVVEAQAAGLPVLMSKGVPLDAVINQEIVEVVSLSEGPKAWAQIAQRMLAAPRVSREGALEKVEASAFSGHSGLSNLLALYE